MSWVNYCEEVSGFWGGRGGTGAHGCGGGRYRCRMDLSLTSSSWDDGAGRVLCCMPCRGIDRLYVLVGLESVSLYF